MALSTYSELQAAIADLLNRSDIANPIKDFITLCEADLNRRLRVREMTARATGATSDQFTVLPSDFLEARNIQINTNPPAVLDYRSPEALDRFRAESGGGTGTPQFYTFIGDTIEIAPTPASSQTLEIVYYKRITPLSDSSTSNFILDSHSDIYLYGSALHSAPFLGSDERVALWASIYDSKVERLNQADTTAQHSGNTLRMLSNPIG